MSNTRSKETLILLIDVGATMHNVLPEVEKILSMLLQKKLVFGRSDQVGIVLFGTDDTDNELEKEVGGYEHVVVLRNIMVINTDAVEIVRKLPRGSFAGDFLDATVVGIDMLLKKFGPKDKGKKRLCLITNALSCTKDPYEGTKEDQVVAICEQMKAYEIKLDCVVVRGKSHPAEYLESAGENDKLLDLFSRKTTGKVVHVDSPTSLLGALRTRNISPVTVFRGDLEISSQMKIKVWVYKKTGEEKFPTLKKYSDKAPPTDKFATHEVKVDFEYKSLEYVDKTVPPEQRIKGYRYGPQVVPISSAEWETVKFKPEKGLKLLGFTDASNIMRHYYMKEVYIFVPEPGNRKAATAISALARAMKEMNKSAILRCVWRQGQGNVVVGVLTPNLSSEDNIPDSFFLNILPFVEDVREFRFPSLNNFPKSLQPTDEQQEATDDLVKSLDLGPSDKAEVLQPDYTPNPTLQQFYSFLDLKSKLPDADIPPLEKSLNLISETDSDIVRNDMSIVQNLQKQFELKENPKKKKTSKRAWQDGPSTKDEINVLGEASEVKKVRLLEDVPRVKVGKIGDSSPVEDFKAMMVRRDDPKWVNQAIEAMEIYITTLLENSYKGDFFPKAIECVAALREGCIIEQEPKEFNSFLLDLYKRWHACDLADFFELLLSKNVTLISKSEASDSDLTEEQARSFADKI